MGFVIKESIFFGGDRGQIRELERRFSTFKYQAAILFSEVDHPEMARVYHGDQANSFTGLDAELRHANSFASLDKDTGRHVCFFGCQEPPQEIRKTGLVVGRPHESGHDDRVLVRSLGRFFGLSHDELPAMVISPNLWRGVVTVIPCISGMDTAGKVLRHLVEVSRRFRRRVSDGALCEHLGRGLPEAHPPRLFEPRRESAGSLQKTYWGYLNLSDSHGSHSQVEKELQRTGSTLAQELREVLASMPEDTVSLEIEAWVDVWMKLMTRFGREAQFLGLPSMLSPPERGARPLPPLHLPRWYEGVDAVSQEMALSALHFERSVALGSLGDLDRFALDHSGLLAGLWKTVEREMNLSFIQLARKHKGIQMPEYFAKWDDKSDEKATIYSLGNDYQVNAEFKGSAIGGNLAMFMLGEGRVFIEALVKKKEEPFSRDFGNLLSEVGTNPKQVIEDLLQLNKVRRKGSHAESVGAGDASDQREIIIDGDLLPAMNRVKRELMPPVEPRVKSSAADICFPGLDDLARSIEHDRQADPSRSRNRSRSRQKHRHEVPVDRAMDLLEGVGLGRLVGSPTGPVRPALEETPLELIEGTLHLELHRLNKKRRRTPGLFDEVQPDSDLDAVRSAVAGKLAAQARLNLEIVERLLSPNPRTRERVAETLSSLREDQED